MNSTNVNDSLIEKVAIQAIKLNPKNPRFIRDSKFNQLVQSLKDFPKMMTLRPIVVDEDGIILGGNMRYRAAKDAGWKDVNIIRAVGLTDEEKDEFILKDNVAFGEWDWDAIVKEWSAYDTEAWGIDVPEGWEQPATVEEPDANNLPTDQPLSMQGDSGNAVSVHYLKSPGLTVLITDEEALLLQEESKEYLKEHTVMIGFVKSLIHAHRQSRRNHTSGVQPSEN